MSQTFPAGHTLHDGTDDPLKKDFRKFLWVVWEWLGLPEPTPVQYDMAYFMQHGPRRKMIMAFRGVGKTYIYGAFVCWRLYCNPDWKIIVVSGAQRHADNISKFIRSLIHGMPILNHLKAKEGQRDTNVEFDVGPAKVSKDPSVKSVGITGQITGSRADEALLDDIETLNNSATQGARESLSEAVKELGGAVVKPGGFISYLGTPQTAMSMYRELPDRGYTIRIWPARVPEDPEIYHGQLAPMIQRMILKGALAGTPVDPKRFDDKDLVEREAEYKKAGFQLQFMLDTSSSDAERYPLKLRDLIVMPLDPRMAPDRVVWGREEVVEDVQTAGLPGDCFYKPIFRAENLSPYNATHMIIDPSGRGKDETAWAVIKELHGTLYLMDIGGTRAGYEGATLETLAKTAKRWGANKLIVESNFGDGMFVALLSPVLRRVGHLCDIEEVRASTQKEARIIDTLEPVLSQHRLVVDEDLINREYGSAESPVYSLFYQLTRLTRDRGSLAQDDRLDALSWAVSSFNDLLVQDTEKAAEEAAQRLLEEELQEWLDHSIGADSRGTYRDNFVYPRGASKGFR